jgi:ElaB/YqjD/DUF883 family membrane-anchored ribosome-binding protein
METTKNTFLVDKFIQGLRNAQIELEAFRVQLALGTYEAKDKFEEVKSSLRDFSVETEDYLFKSGVLSDDKKVNIAKAFETLRLQLALGKAEAKDAFYDQKENIEKQMSHLENLISEDDLVTEAKERLMTEFEKVKIKMELLQVQYSLGKMEAKEELEKRKFDLSDKFDEVEELLKEKSEEYTAKFQNVKSEMKSAFNNFKKSLSL